MNFQPERFAAARPDIEALVDEHWAEVGSYKDEFDRVINYTQYHELERQGRLLTVTARREGALIGYMIGALGQDLHRVDKETAKRVLVCSILVYYMVPAYRGYARSLLGATERAAAQGGAQVITQRTKPGKNRADEFFAKSGYDVTEIVHSKLIGSAARARSADPTR